jgi:hypothetical protein
MSNVHSIYGRMLGYRTVDGELAIYNPSADAVQISGIVGQGETTTVTTTSGTLKAYGLNVISASSAAVFTLPTPAGKGRRMTIQAGTASTSQTVSISSASGQFLTTQGTSVGYVAIFKALGAAVSVHEASTYWVVLAKPTTDSVHFTS